MIETDLCHITLCKWRIWSFNCFQLSRPICQKVFANYHILYNLCPTPKFWGIEGVLDKIACLKRSCIEFKEYEADGSSSVQY